MEERCATCHCWREQQCRVEPPKPMLDAGDFRLGSWPVVSPDGWCSLWRAARPQATVADTRPGASSVEIQDNGIVTVTHFDGDTLELSALEGLSDKDKLILERMAWMPAR